MFDTKPLIIKTRAIVDVPIQSKHAVTFIAPRKVLWINASFKSMPYNSVVSEGKTCF